MSLATLKTDLLALEDAIKNNPKPAAIIRAAAAVQVDVADVLDLFMASPNEDPDKGECCAIAARIKAHAEEALAVNAAGPVGAWGDGAFIKALLTFLITNVLPLILNTPTPAPTP